MDRSDVEEHLEKALGMLMDFQRSTVNVLYRQFYKNDVRSMLVADEVGLGKTVVAKGLLARVLLKRLEEGEGLHHPLKVTYICSNQVIARENLRKLHLFPDDAESDESISRISYLAEAPPERSGNGGKTLLRINTLTPATSFQISNSTGMQWERALIYGLLCKDPLLKRDKLGLGWMLKDGVEKMRRFRRTLSYAGGRNFRPDLPARFLKALRAETVPLEEERIYEHLRGSRERTVYQAVKELCRDLDGARAEKARHRACQGLTKHLRRILIHCCLDYVDADLYILDEFQRFRDLIEDDDTKEQALIARRVFGKENTKILLLSATPFKAFTGQADHDGGEEHFADFRRVLSFLLDSDEQQLAEYDAHRSGLYRQLIGLRPGQCDFTSEHREKIEALLRSRICRTERHVVGAASNSLVEDTWKSDRLPFGTGDVRNFILTDEVVQALEKVASVHGKPIEFCKSALYPLSFLDSYQLKERLKANRKPGGVLNALRKSRPAWVDLEKVHDYKWELDCNSDGPSHAGLKLLAEKAIGNRGAEMLWLPPSLPYYPLEHCFAEDPGFTKTLLFSSWVMVPRMISTLLSYEVERKTIGDPKSKGEQEKGEREYFKKVRSPVPQITYEAKGEDRQLANMSNFTLLYPSQSLAAAILPKLNLRGERPLADLKAEAEERIQSMIEERDLARHVKRSIGGERWYWAAPLLLDREEPRFRAAFEQWATGLRETWGRDTFFETRGKDPGVKEEHAEAFVRCFDDPDSISFGPIPRGLAGVLADLALGSPAVLTFRTLSELFPEEESSVLMVHAFKVADQFCELFNKPESIAAVRMSVPHHPVNAAHHPYWRMASNYSASGCLQAVLDEYLHLLKGQNLDLESMMTQLLDAVNLNSSPLKVDSLDTFLSDESRHMRCHYATAFGNQDLDRESGQARATGLREVFNSPFRPFVLASTSIGQEGLDFHSYCRRIVHWNLPSNPIDLEQREGRINRYKSLVIRQHLAKKYRTKLAEELSEDPADTWERLFAIAEKGERVDPATCELVPYWHADTDEHKIERIIPNFPFSQDEKRLERTLRTLAIYRLAFGQPRQEELVEHLLARGFSDEELEQIRETLIVDLCPISYSQKQG